MAAMTKQAMLDFSIEDQKAAAPVAERPKKVAKSVCSEEQELTPEEIQWLSLLRTRPNFDSMEESSKWLNSVIECSLASSQQAVPNQPPAEVEAYGLFADEADEILSALGCSDEEKHDDDGGRKFHFDFDEL
jgi:hypothetical protein